MSDLRQVADDLWRENERLEAENRALRAVAEAARAYVAATERFMQDANVRTAQAFEQSGVRLGAALDALTTSEPPAPADHAKPGAEAQARDAMKGAEQRGAGPPTAGGSDSLCVCGHTRRWHEPLSRAQCDCPSASNPAAPCDCPSFRPASPPANVTCSKNGETSTRPEDMSAPSTRPPLKKDAGKPRMDLIPPAALIESAKVLGFGAAKYSAHGWKQASAEWSRYIAAAYRHLTAFNAGEDLDPESGMPHLAHAACCLFFLLQYQVEGSGVDDRCKSPEVLK